MEEIGKEAEAARRKAFAELRNIHDELEKRERDHAAQIKAIRDEAPGQYGIQLAIDTESASDAIKQLNVAFDKLRAVKLSVAEECAVIIERCQRDDAFARELRAQMRELRGLPR